MERGGLASSTKVLLVLSQGVFDRARIFAGNATIALKLPVSLQIVLRALIEEGLKRHGDTAIFANVEAQARAVRHIRRRQGRDHERDDRREGRDDPARQNRK
jgi:hypothetical protein